MVINVNASNSLIQSTTKSSLGHVDKKIDEVVGSKGTLQQDVVVISKAGTTASESINVENKKLSNKDDNDGGNERPIGYVDNDDIGLPVVITAYGNGGGIEPP